MRTIAEIEADLQDIEVFDEVINVTFRGQKTNLPIIRLLRDIPDFLARIDELEKRNGELCMEAAGDAEEMEGLGSRIAELEVQLAAARQLREVLQELVKHLRKHAYFYGSAREQVQGRDLLTVVEAKIAKVERLSLMARKEKRDGL